MRSVLLVEDNPLDVRLTLDSLQEAGLECAPTVVGDGERALCLLQGIGGEQPAFDLVVLDLNLPKRSGFEVLAYLRHTPNLAAIPVVVFSGSLNPKDREAALSGGAAAFISKPRDLVDFTAVGRRLKGVLDRR
jgi:two-component system, chemotaxis family, response regulator Rcp1